MMHIIIKNVKDKTNTIKFSSQPLLYVVQDGCHGCIIRMIRGYHSIADSFTKEQFIIWLLKEMF
jgi:hypothetical protein